MDKNDEKDGRPLRDSRKSERGSAKDGTHRKESVAGEKENNGGGDNEKDGAEGAKAMTRPYLVERVEEELFRLMPKSGQCVPLGTVCSKAQRWVDRTAGDRLSKKWYQRHPSSFVLHKVSVGGRTESEWQVQLTLDAHARVKVRLRELDSEERRQELLHQAELSLATATIDKIETGGLCTKRVAALLCVLGRGGAVRAVAHPGLASACSRRLCNASCMEADGRVEATPKALHRELMPFAPAAVMQAIVAVSQACNDKEDWDDRALELLLQSAALDLHVYAEWPRAHLTVAADSLQAASRPPFVPLLKTGSYLLTAAAVLRLEIEVSDDESAMHPCSTSFHHFAQLCCGVSHIVDQGYYALEHWPGMLRGFEKVTAACEALHDSSMSAAHAGSGPCKEDRGRDWPEGLCCLATAIALISREVRAKGDRRVDQERSGQSRVFGAAALHGIASWIVAAHSAANDQEQLASCWSAEQVTILSEAFATAEAQGQHVDELFRRLAVIAKSHARSGAVVWTAEQLWRLHRSAWSLRLLQTLESLLRHLQATHALRKHAEAALPTDLPMLLNISVLMDDPTALEASAECCCKDDLQMMSVSDLLGVLDAWPRGTADGSWRRLDGLRGTILDAVMAAMEHPGTDPPRHEQVLALLRLTKEEMCEAPRRLWALGRSHALLKAAPKLGPTDEVCRHLTELLGAFAEYGVPVPRLESVCAARLLRSVDAAEPQDLNHLIPAVHMLASLGALEAMPAVVAALAELPVARQAAQLRSVDASVLCELLRVLLQAASDPRPCNDVLLSEWTSRLEGIAEDAVGKGGVLQLTIENISGTIVANLRCSHYDTVYEVKQRLVRFCGALVGKQQLVYGNSVLQDCDTLACSGIIGSKATIQYVSIKDDDAHEEKDENDARDDAAQEENDDNVAEEREQLDGQPTLELERLADLAEPHLREARKELGPAWLEALLTRSTVLTWGGGPYVRRGQPLSCTATQGLAEAIAGLPIKGGGDGDSCVAASEQEEDCPQWPPALVVRGDMEEGLWDTVGGTYAVCGENHGRAVYRRTAPRDELEVMLYFWDEGDGPDQQGWWFGPEVGGDQVWAHHASAGSHPAHAGRAAAVAARPPPSRGWMVLHEGKEEPGLTVLDCRFRARGLSGARDGARAARHSDERDRQEAVVEEAGEGEGEDDFLSPMQEEDAAADGSRGGHYFEEEVNAAQCDCDAPSSSSSSSDDEDMATQGRDDEFDEEYAAIPDMAELRRKAEAMACLGSVTVTASSAAPGVCASATALAGARPDVEACGGAAGRSGADTELGQRNKLGVATPQWGNLRNSLQEPEGLECGNAVVTPCAAAPLEAMPKAALVARSPPVAGVGAKEAAAAEGPLPPPPKPQSVSSQQKQQQKHLEAGEVVAELKRKREEGRGEREAKFREWLINLDDGVGAMLQYEEVLIAEFDADLTQLAAVKRDADAAEGLLGFVDPIFWEIVCMRKLGHRMLIARGIMKL